MKLELFSAGKLIGSIVRSGRNVAAWLPDGSALGQFADLDAAAVALMARA